MNFFRYCLKFIFLVISVFFFQHNICLAKDRSVPSSTIRSWSERLYGGAVFQQGFRGPLEQNLNSAVLLQLRHDTGRIFVPLNIGPSFYYLNDKTLEKLNLSKSHQYLGKGLQLETGFSLYLFSTNISAYTGLGVLAVIGEAIDPGQIAEFKTSVDGGILNDDMSITTEIENAKRLAIFSPYLLFGIEFMRKHPFLRFFLEFRCRYDFSNRDNGWGPQFSIGFVFRKH